jgi:hypothetical protein
VRIVEEFHRRVNRGQLQDVYEDADPAFQRSLDIDAWVEYMRENQIRCGAFKRSTSSRFDVVMDAPVRIRAVYESDFEKCNATELFAFIREGAEIRLAAHGVVPPRTPRSQRP